jgi:hypothetical protein
MKEFVKTTTHEIELVTGETETAPNLAGLEYPNDAVFTSSKVDDFLIVRVSGTKSQIQKLRDSSVEVISDETALKYIRSNHPNTELENVDVIDIEIKKEINKYSYNELLTDKEVSMCKILHGWKPLSDKEKIEILNTHGYHNRRKMINSLSKNKLDSIYNKYNVEPELNKLETYTIVSSVVQVQTLGSKVLQDQDLTVLLKLAKQNKCVKSENLPNNTIEDMSGEYDEISRQILNGETSTFNKMVDYSLGRSDSVPWSDSESPPGCGGL